MSAVLISGGFYLFSFFEKLVSFPDKPFSLQLQFRSAHTKLSRIVFGHPELLHPGSLPRPTGDRFLLRHADSFPQGRTIAKSRLRQLLTLSGDFTNYE